MDFIMMFPYALLISLLLGIISPFYGLNVSLRKVFMLSLALPQVSLLGIALGLIIGIPPYISSMLLTVLAGYFLSTDTQKYRINSEAIAVILFLFSNAFLYVLLSITDVSYEQIKDTISGNFLIANKEDFILYAVMFFISILFFLKHFKKTILIATDNDFVKTISSQSQIVEKVFFVLLSLFISISTKVVGNILSFSSLIIPILVGMSFSNRFGKIVFAGIIFNLVSIYLGLYLSYRLDIASSYLIVVLQIILFLLVMAAKHLIFCGLISRSLLRVLTLLKI